MITVLLVDDDEDCRLMIREAMRDGNLEPKVFEVGSGEEALDFMFRRGKWTDAPAPGLIYLDIDMPGISGLDVLKEIRSHDRFRAIPVVVMTNLDDDKEKSLAAQYGANSYTLKPNDPLQFIQTVIEATNYWIGVHRRPGEGKTADEPKSTSA